MADVASLAVGLHLNAANFRSQLTGAYAGATTQSRKFNRAAQDDAAKTEAAYKRLSGTIGGLAGRIAGFAGVGFSLGTIIQTTRQYGQALSDLSAITGATGAQLKIYDEAAQQLGRSTQFSAAQAVEAFTLLASAKPELLETANGLTQTTESALVLAQAAGTTLPDATRALALSLNQFGVGAEQADRYINVLAAGAKFGASEVVDTTAAIKNGGVAAAQAGVGFEQLNAAIQVLAEREIKGGEAGTALRNVILNLEKGTDKTLKPSVVGLSVALGNLAAKNLSTKQAVKLFGVENINAASILVQNRTKLDELTQSLTGTQTAHEQAAIRVNNLNGDLLGLTSAFEGLVIKVGQSSSGALRDGIQGTTSVLNTLADNFSTVSNIALYTLIPVLSTKLTAGLRENISAWRENQAAVRANIQAQADIARKTLDATAATLKRNDAEYGHFRQLEKNARQYGLNVSYQGDFNRLIREETEQTRLATQAKAQLSAANRQLSVSARAASVAIGLGRGALALVGGPLGAATLAASALFFFQQQAKDARDAALALKDSVVLTTAELIRMSQTKLAVKLDDYQEQLDNINSERSKVQSQLSRYSDTRIQLAKGRKEGALGFLFSSPEELTKERNQLKSQLEDLDTAAKRTQENLRNARIAANGQAGAIDTLLPPPAAPTNPLEAPVSSPWTGEDISGGKAGGRAQVDKYSQLRREIEEEHSSSLVRINLQEQESARQLAEAARQNGASDADLQRTLLLNAENYQRQRVELAAQYSPARAALNQEQEASTELTALFKARLLDEGEYQAARVTLAQETARQLAQARADVIAAPLLDVAGEVDPLADLRNQLVQRTALLQAYAETDVQNKERYELLQQKASKDSADAQYQTALELYRAQGDLQNLSLGLIETTQERTTNMLTGILTGTQSFKESLTSLFSSLTQSIIKNLVDMAAQALITKTLLSSFTGIFGGGGGAATGAVASSGTAISDFAAGFSFNAKGGVYDSPSLSSFSNNVYDSPQMFAFAKGAGVFGEAGPEAIMPLTRAADGSLGVRAVGGGNAGTAAPQVYITIEGGNTSTQTSPGLEQFGVEVGRFVDQRYKQNVMRDISPGGDIWNALKGGR